jgi:hypothetical protein
VRRVERTEVNSTEEGSLTTMGTTKARVWSDASPGFTKSHEEVLLAMHRGQRSTQSVAADLCISPRLARALMEDLLAGRFIHRPKAVKATKKSGR